MPIWKNNMKYVLIATMLLGFLLPALSAIAAIPDVPATGAYIEAEDYVDMGAANPYAWSVQSSISGYQGSGYLYTSNGGTSTTTYGSRVDFPVNFTTAGTYQIWLRARDGSPTSGGDSTFWGVDGTVLGILTENSRGAWEWTTNVQSGTNQVTISTAGSHTINLWPREKNQHTDAIFIIQSSQTLPSEIYEDSTSGQPSGYTALDFTSTTTASGYITIADDQYVNGSTIDLVADTAVDANDLVYKTDLSSLYYRPLAEQTDGFNAFTVDSKWTKTDVGGYTTASAAISSNALELIGSGVDIWNTRDSFSYLYQSGISGNFTVDVKVTSLALSSGTGSINNWAKAGIMVRQSLATNSRHASVVVTPANGVSFQRRKTDGSSSLSSTVTGTVPKWLRIQRDGSTFNTYRSDDATTWTLVATDTITMSDPLLVGLAVTSHSTSQQVKATFDHYMFTDTLMNATGGWVGVATAFDADSAAWEDGVRAMGLMSGSTFAANTFDYSSCVDSTPSSITIPASQTVTGSTVSLTSLYSTEGNLSTFTYQIDGVGVNNPWNSAAVGTAAEEDVTLTVTGVDPDCSGRTVSTSQTITVDNTCQDETPSTITISTDQSTGGYSIDVSELFSYTGDVSSFTYTINGGAEIPIGTLWDSTSVVTVGDSGSVTLGIQGIDPNDSCPEKSDIKVSTSNTIYIDNACGAVDPTILFDESPKYVTAGKQVAYTVTVYNNDSLICDAMDISLALVSDSNPSSFNTTTLSTSASQSIAARGSATWTMTVGAQSDADEWQVNTTTVRATVDADPNADHSHSTVDASTKTYVFQVSPITHNSVTTKSTKWDSDWGTSTSTSKYGNFTCLTCHEKDSPNVKWMRETIATPDGTNWGVSGYNSLTVKFYDALDDSLDWGNDDPDGDDGATDSKGGKVDTNAGVGRNASTRSCEVCHSITMYHRYDTETDPDGAGELEGQTADQRTHFNDRDCIDCHRHSEGFTADCSNCHGNPPINDTHGGPDGLADVPGKTGSSTAGTHYKHVVVLKFPCTYCHANYRNPDQMPRLASDNGTTTVSDDLYDINHTFDVFGSTEEAATTGNYTGQDGVYYEGVQVASGEGTLTCENIYCHGGTDNMGGNNPQWNSNITCDACHGTSATNTPPGYSHSTHVGTMGIGCSVCHGDDYGNTTEDNADLEGYDGDTVKGHVNGSVHIDLTHLTEAPYNNANPTYRGVTTWDSGTLAPSATYGYCSDIACHFNNDTPVWNNGPANCTTCHNNTGDDGESASVNWGNTTDLTNAASDTGNHNEHCDPETDTIHETMIDAFVNKCESCHGASANSGDHVGHIDFSATFAGGFSYDSSDASCTNSCHATDSGPNNWNSTTTLPCQYCHMAKDQGDGTYSSYIGPTVVDTLGAGGGTAMATSSGYGSHLKGTTSDSLALSVSGWEAQCRKCHPYHEGGVLTANNDTSGDTGDYIPTSWDNPATTTVETDDMQEKLGLQYPITGGIHLSYNSMTTEAEICWSCHGSDDDINEWGFNVDTNGTSLPYTKITDLNSETSASHNYGWVYTDSTWTTMTSAWVDSSSKGSYRKDGYQHYSSTTPSYVLSRRISSVHSANFTAFDPTATGPDGASVAKNIDTSGNVIRTDSQTLESRSQIRCTYCHDVHDMNRALDLTGVAETSTGRPYLRGSWFGNPYAPDLPPINTYSYPTSGGYHSNGQRFSKGTSTSTVMSNAVPRLLSNPDLQSKGGYFIDQNSNWPTSTKAEDLSDTAGICVICHGNDVDTMDYYTESSMWRDSTGNGHANSALGGSGASSSYARNIFDGRRAGSDFYMGAQDGVNYTEYGDKTSVKSNGPYRSTFREAAKTASNSPPRNMGWYGGTLGSTTRGSQYSTWYTGNTSLTNTASIGTNGGSNGRAHDFTCSKCHSPHATGMPALLITNCVDYQVSDWQRTGNNSTVIGPKATNTYAKRVPVNCHRKESTTTGWHRLNVKQ